MNSNSEAFALFFDLLAIAGDPATAKARVGELKGLLEAIDRGAEKLAADRQSFEAEMVEVRRKAAEETEVAARRLTAAAEKERELKTQEERLAAEKERVGFWEPPSEIAIGSGGLTMSVLKDAAPPRPARAAPTAPPRVSGERFGQSTLSRAANDEAPPTSLAPAFRPTTAKPNR